MTFMNLKEHASPSPRLCRSTIVVTLLLTATYISALKADARLAVAAVAAAAAAAAAAGQKNVAN